MYQIKPLWKICEILLWGTPPRNNNKNFGWDFLWCSIRDMKTKYIFDTNEKLTNLWVKNSNVKLLKEWTLFMSFKLSLWKLAFAWKDLYTNETIAWLPIKNENELDKEFLYYILSWYDFTASWIDNSVKWATLNKAKLEILPIPLPPLLIQKLIVQKLDSAFENIDKNINFTKENLENLKELNSNILKDIFSEWNLTEIWKLLEKTSNWNPKIIWDDFFEYIDISAIDNKDYILIETKKIKWIEAPSRAKQLVTKNDIIFATTRPNLKNITIINLDVENLTSSTGFCVLRTIKDKLYYKFLFYYLITDIFQEKIIPFIRWAQYPAISDKDLKSLSIPLPPLQKQKEIVSYLDEVFAKNKELKTKYEIQLKELEELKQSLLKDAFEGRLVKD